MSTALDPEAGARASGACTELQAGELGRPGMAVRLWLHICRLNLLWSISSTEAYMLAAERDGILEGRTLRAWRDRMAADRVEVALIEARLRGDSVAGSGL